MSPPVASRQRIAHQLGSGAHLFTAKHATAFDKLVSKRLKSDQDSGQQFDDDHNKRDGSDDDKNGDESDGAACKGDFNSNENSIGVETGGQSAPAHVLETDQNDEEHSVETELNSGELGNGWQNSITFSGTNGANNSNKGSPLVRIGSHKHHIDKQKQQLYKHQRLDGGLNSSSLKKKLNKTRTATRKTTMTKTIGEHHYNEYTILADGDLWAVE